MSKVLLINPAGTQQEGFTNPPIGLLSLAGTLLRDGFAVQLVDGCVEGAGAIDDALRSFRPELVGITCLTPARRRALEAARRCRELVPEAQVVLGGAHPTIMPRQLLEHYPEIDAVVLGEGELTFHEIARGVPLRDVPGVVCRSSGEILRTARRDPVRDLDTLAAPAWQLAKLDRYPARGSGVFRGIDLAREPRVSVVYSRGCTGSCDFCSTWWIWKGWRHRSANNMVDELQYLHDERGVRHFCFADDALTIDRSATLALCDEILARKLNVAFHATTRTDCVDEEVLARLQAAGCYQISYGVESGSQTILDSLGKHNDIAHAERAISLTKAAGIRCTALMIVGNVGETEATLIESIDFLQRTSPDDVGCVGGLWVLPGTKLHTQCKKKGFISDDFWLGDEPCKTYTLEWSVAALNEMQRLITNFAKLPRIRPAMSAPAPVPVASALAAGPSASLLDKWRRYVRVDVHEYSATTDWSDAQAEHTELMSKLPQTTGDLLDLGCGDGWSTDRLRKLGFRARGVTLNAREAAHAQNRYGLDQLVCDMHDLQVPDASVDGIYCRESLEHTVAPFIALCEMNRVLRPGGFLLINLPWEEWIREDSHFSVLTPSQMHELLYKCRFAPEAEGRTSSGHYWYRARKAAELTARNPLPAPIPGRPWLPRADATPVASQRDPVSVVTPLVPQSRKVAACLSSLGQNLVPADEIIVVEHGAPDGELGAAYAFAATMPRAARVIAGCPTPNAAVQAGVALASHGVVVWLSPNMRLPGAFLDTLLKAWDGRPLAVQARGVCTCLIGRSDELRALAKANSGAFLASRMDQLAFESRALGMQISVISAE